MESDALARISLAFDFFPFDLAFYPFFLISPIKPWFFRTLDEPWNILPT
jgi:hypothetical protein